MSDQDELCAESDWIADRKRDGLRDGQRADGNACLFRVNDMMAYVERVFGRPDKIVKSPRPDDFAGMKGIIVVKGSGWRNARGHVTLWDGARCSDTCHLMADPENGRFIPDAGSLWVLQ
ncbi:T6SS effector amidase Tae4 family protein [Burkholderia latens]|uniref:T6SS effector amidase Tae4 family protein n=1 Tax=Burkholderia latens TaxID=488446 RepID=UPI001ABAE229|nr:T6SS effector amidase Tae4 family protein [Burkholderia latens]